MVLETETPEYKTVRETGGCCAMTGHTEAQIIKTRRRDRYAIIAFLLLVLTVWAALSAAPRGAQAYVPKVDGVINLLDFDFENTVQVIAGFENYDSWPQNLYTPEDFFLGIPGEPQVLQWADYRRTDRLQYATHRLTILLPPGEIYALSMKTAVYSQRLFIDGEEIGSVGNPTASKDEFVPGTLERTYFFTPQTEQIEIIMHTANYTHGKSGCNPPDSITLGKAENINILNRRNTFLNAIILGCLLTSALYHFSLFILNRRRVTTLLFSVCCLLLALMDKKLFFYLFPNFSWYVEIRMEYLIHFFTFAGLVWFIYLQFPKMLHKAVVYPYSVLALLYCLTVAFDTSFFTGILAYFEYLSIAVIAYVVLRFIMSIKSGRIPVLLGLAGVLVLGLTGINDILETRTVASLFTIAGQLFTVPVGMVFFVFCYSLIIAIENAETQRREEALTERNAMLDGLNRTKTEFLQDMSHEMKAPLTVIATGIDFADREIGRDGGDLAEARSALDVVREETQRLGRMVSGMISLATMSGIAENRKRVDFAALLGSSAEAFRLPMEKYHNALRVKIDPDLPDVFVEHDRFTQVMANLLTNAADHTRDGQVFVTAEHDGPVITVQVSDTGDGIERSLLPAVLERGVSGRGGTGYGLYICKTVVEAHGGTIKIESEPGKGTTVTFTVPVYGGQEAGHRL